MEPLRTSAATHGIFTVINLVGELDYATADRAHGQCQQALAKASPHLILDVSA